MASIIDVHQRDRFAPNSKPANGLCSSAWCKNAPVIDIVDDVFRRALCADCAPRCQYSGPTMARIDAALVRAREV